MLRVAMRQTVFVKKAEAWVLKRVGSVLRHGYISEEEEEEEEGEEEEEKEGGVSSSYLDTLLIGELGFLTRLLQKQTMTATMQPSTTTQMAATNPGPSLE